MIDEEFVRQMEIMTERSLRQMGSVPPSPARVKEEPPSPPRYCIKQEPAGKGGAPGNRGGVQIGRHVKEDPASPLCNLGIQIKHHVKDKLAPPPGITYTHA